MIRIVGIDLDGTLLTDDKEICKRNIEALHKAADHHIKVVLCSGRAPEGMQRELTVLGLRRPGQYGIGLNGGIIFETATGRMIHRVLMGENSARVLVGLGRQLSQEVNIQLYTGEHIYVERRDHTTDFYEKATNSQVQKVDDLTVLADQAVKLVYFTRGSMDPSLQRINDLKRRVEPQIPKDSQCVISAPYLLELFGNHTDKGKSILSLADQLGISQEEILCIGDQENDLPMLSAAGISVAMQNGTEAVKQVADYVTEADNNQGGVAEAVVKFVLQDE